MEGGQSGNETETERRGRARYAARHQEVLRSRELRTVVHVVLAAGNGLNSSAFAGFDLSALRALREVRSGRRGCALQAVHVRRTAAPSLAGAGVDAAAFRSTAEPRVARSMRPLLQQLLNINSSGRA